MISEEREFGGSVYFNCNHLTEQEMARIHGLPSIELPNHEQKPVVKLGVIYRFLSKAALRWGDIPIIGRLLWWAVDMQGNRATA